MTVVRSIRRVRITAPSIERALGMAGNGKPGKEVRVVFPLDPGSFFAADATPGVAPGPGLEAA
jgi:hypothetical protein